MKKIMLSIIAILLSNTINAEYTVKIPLDDININSEVVNPIVGDATLSNYTINRGESSNIIWNYQYADQVNISHLGVYGSSGNETINPLRTTTYTVNATSATDSTTKTLTLNVIQPIPAITFNSDKTQVGVGQPVNLNWSVVDAETVGISTIGNNLSLIGTETVFPASDITYTLTASGYESSGNVTRSISIDVVANSLINSFNASKTAITKGESVLFDWNVSDSEGLTLLPYGAVSGTPTGSQNVTFNTVGSFDYTLRSLNFSGSNLDSSPININVYEIPVISSFEVNGSKNINVTQNDPLNFAWTTQYSSSLRFNGSTITGTSNVLTATNIGSLTYTLEALNQAGYVVSDEVTVNVVSAGAITSFTGPNNVFINEPFTLNWVGSNIEKYEISSNNANSGVLTTATDIGTVTTRSVTPTNAGSFTYTLDGYNEAETKVSSTKTVAVEALPTFTGFTVNGATTINVSPNTTLTFVGAGFSSGATLQGRNSAGTANATLPATASASAGTITYYASATKTLNSINKYSTLRSVVVNVIDAPTIGTITAPTTVFANAAFNMSWSGTNVTNYKIRGNVAASGVAITDVDLTTATTRAITPTASGTYTYTITATNAAGITTTSTSTVVVEADPTFTGFTVNGETTDTVAQSASLTFVGTGFSSGATIQGRNSAGTANAALPTTASASAGETIYYASASKSLNSVTRYSALRSVAVTVIASPVIGTITAPTNVFANAGFNISWSGDNGNNVINYKISGNRTTSGVSTTGIHIGTNTSTVIAPTGAGTHIYTITATNSIGITSTATSTVVVEADPIFTGFTVNGSTTASVAPSATLTFDSTGFSTGATIQGRNSAGTANATLPTTASASVGTTTYYASATKSLNSVTRYSELRSVSVNVVAAPVIEAITAPTNVFANAAFNMNWSGTNVTNYKIKGNVAASGISTADADLGVATLRYITPTAAGTYTYTITATNSVGITSTSTSTVVVEADPTFTGFTVNGSTTASVAPSSALTFLGTGFSTGATLQGRNSEGTANATLPATASASVGSTTYYASARKSLNSVTRYSALRSVAATVVSNPTIGTITAPSPVFMSEPFTMSWSGTNVTSWTIRANSASSGVSTTDVTTTTSRSITPTAAGTYTYTITATNAAGVTATSTSTVVVEGVPTLTGLTANGVAVGAASTMTLAPNAALNFVSSGLSAGAADILFVDGNLRGMSGNAPATAGTYSYAYAAFKTLNGVTKTSTGRNLTLTVAAAKVCNWKTTAPITMWTYNPGGLNPWEGYHRAFWDGVQVLNSSGNPVFVTTVTTGGYKYTMTQSPATICREPA